jgi:hypothetical protein
MNNKVLHEVDSLHIVNKNGVENGKVQQKSINKAEEYRKRGNILFSQKDYHAAIEAYSLSVCHAPCNSECLALAFGKVNKFKLNNSIQTYLFRKPLRRVQLPPRLAFMY